MKTPASALLAGDVAGACGDPFWNLGVGRGRLTDDRERPAVNRRVAGELHTRHTACSVNPDELDPPRPTAVLARN